MRSLRISLTLTLVATVAGLVGCGGGGASTPTTPTPAPPTMATFDVSVSNLTNSQPLSPILAVLHADTFQVFTVGAPATAALETLAEGGDNADLAAAAEAAGVVAMVSGAAPVGPAGSDALMMQIPRTALPGLELSVTTMLVNTNDAFTGLNGMLVGDMEIGDTLSMRTPVYDSGTEANSEALGTIPGPADGGEGFNAARDDRADQVTMHSGVVTMADGLTTSILTEQHRFDNPAATIVVQRLN